VAEFKATRLTEGEWVVVALSGECDLSERATLATELGAAVADCHTVVVDLTDLGFIDSAGIHELVKAYHAARERQNNLYVRNASGIVASVLEITGVGELLALPSGETESRGDSA
jgi:anti-anti-sigma factor